MQVIDHEELQFPSSYYDKYGAEVIDPPYEARSLLADFLLPEQKYLFVYDQAVCVEMAPGIYRFPLIRVQAS